MCTVQEATVLAVVLDQVVDLQQVWYTRLGEHTRQTGPAARRAALLPLRTVRG